MARPKSVRLIGKMPAVKIFQPVGTDIRSFEEVFITLDEIEAIRLADLEGYYQEQVAEKMNISRQTVGRILNAAHKKIADALIKGKTVKLEGGPIQFYDGEYFRGCGQVLNSEDSAVDLNVEIHKVAVSSSGPSLDSKVAMKFGQSEYIIVMNIKDGSLEILDNSGAGDFSKGKGKFTAQQVIDSGTQVVITGNIGQKAIRLLSSAGIRVFLVDSSVVRNVFEEFQKYIMYDKS